MKKNTCILIVEDEALVALQLKMSLAGLGYRVCRAVATGERAIQAASEERPDIVLMDIQLKGRMSGLDAAGEIRAFSGIPILFMTGYSMEIIHDRIEEFRPAAYLIKPVATAELESALQSLLDGEESPS